MDLVIMVAVGFVIAAALGVILPLCANWSEKHLVKRPELPELHCAQCRRSMREAQERPPVHRHELIAPSLLLPKPPEPPGIRAELAELRAELAELRRRG